MQSTIDFSGKQPPQDGESNSTPSASGWWIVGGLYFTAWVIVGLIFIPQVFLIAVWLPLLLSIFTTVLTTIMDEGGGSAVEIRGSTIARKACINAHLALGAFDLAVVRGVPFANISSTMKDYGLLLFFFSLIFAAVGVICRTRHPAIPPVLAAVAFALVLGFGFILNKQDRVELSNFPTEADIVVPRIWTSQ